MCIRDSYCILDGGMNHLTYLGQMMGMKTPIIKHHKNTPKQDERPEKKTWCLCGSLCTTSDILCREVELNHLEIGDTLIFENVGAYSVTEGIYLFLSRTLPRVYLKDENIPELLDAGKYDFIVDAIDTISPKCFLIYEAMKRRIRIVSSMGAGAKSDITQVRFADLWDTYHCGLSKAVRKRLQKMGMKRTLPVVFSTEQADAKAVLLTDDEQNKKSTCGTVSYMPAVFGCYLAEYVIKRL